jgi:hypothetical protein
MVSFTHDTLQKYELKIDHYTQSNQWEKVLENVKKLPNLDIKTTFQTNQALYHLGYLSSDMFMIPQVWGTKGLILTKELGFDYPLLNCQFYYNLGLLNEAIHWGHESLVLKGETGWVLEKLGFLYLITGEKDAANIFISKLNQTLLFKKNAKKLKEILTDEINGSDDPEIVAAHSQVIDPDSDFVYYSELPDLTLERLLTIDPHNKMAFEYLMAYYLLKGNLVQFIKQLIRIKNLGYKEIPNHYQEAILLYLSNSKDKNLPFLKGYTILKSTINKFNQFIQIMKKFNGNPQMARDQLYENYRNTYWYYFIYYKLKDE